ATTTPSARRWSTGAPPADGKILRPPANVDTTSSIAKVAEPAPASKWVIQLGATDDETKAKDILARARAKASGPLADASPFTEKVEARGATLYRARFAGFEESKDAEKACAQLKRGGFACFATRG
ncbi:SPOR domain-containing protein, partial [Bosea rubneri]